MSQLPKSEKNTLDIVPLSSVSQAKSWVQTLPLANMGEMTRILYQNLMALNKHSLSPAVRIDITEIILPYVNKVLENLDRNYSTQAFPLPVRSQTVFDLKLLLQLELANSYQLAALEMLKQGRINKKRLTIAIGRAINHMGQTLVNSYAVYIKTKRNIWHHMHNLYLRACENEIQNKKIPKNIDAEADVLTIESYYKLFNLVALGVPNSLRQGDVKRIEAFFSSIINDVATLTDASLVSGDYAHIALLNSDEPAAFLPVDEVFNSGDGSDLSKSDRLLRDFNSATSRIFDISKVESILHDFIEITKDKNFGLHNDQPMLNRGLAERLVARLRQSNDRRDERLYRNEDDMAGVVMRLNDVVELISATTNIDENDGSRSSAEDSLYENIAQGGSASSPWADNDIESPLENCDAEIKSWFISNSSASGYRLRQKLVEQSSARVGEIIAINDSADKNEQWQIAVIRWMDFYRDRGFCLGAELLASSAINVVVTEVTNREITQRLPINGIQLSVSEGLREQPALILPGYIFKVNDTVAIEFGGKYLQEIQITSIDENIGSFAYCEYIVLEKEEVEEEADFSAIWEIL